jgi:hypothetical protein
LPGACVSAEAESFRSLGVTVFEEVEAAGVLVVLPDIARSLRENGDAAEESSVGLMAVRDRPESLPSVAAKLIEPAVISGTSIGVRGNGLPALQSGLGQVSPRDGRRRIVGRHLRRIRVVEQSGLRLVVAGKQRRLWSEQVTERSHDDHCAPTPAEVAAGHPPSRIRLVVSRSLGQLGAGKVSEKDESKPRADEPATEAIPKQGGAAMPTPPKRPESVEAKPAATPPARPSSEKSDPPESTPVPSESLPETADAPTQAVDITKPDRKKTDPAEAETTALPKVVRAQPRAVAKPPVGPRRIPARGEDPRPRSSAQQAKPLRVGPTTEQTKPRSKGGRRWIAALAAAVLLFAAVGVAGYLYLSGDHADNSPDAQIRTQVTSFTEALSSGNLATLRASSCGDLAVYYREIPDAEFAEVHRIAAEQGNIPVVDGIDAVQITGDTAIVQVLAYTAANPNERSPRTFDLRLEGEDWKVCNPE